MKRMAWALSTDREAQDQSGRRNAWGSSERRDPGTNALHQLPQDLMLHLGEPPGKPATVGSQGKQPPMSHFTRKSVAKVAKAVDSYNCLSTTKAARSNDDWEYETVLFVPYTPDGALAAALRAYGKASRKTALAEEFKERPEGKRCRIDVCPQVGTSPRSCTI